MSREHRFEIIEHTADVGVVGKGSTMAEAFENAAYGMFSLMADLEKYEPTLTRSIAVVGGDDVTLLERFLSALLLLFDADRLLPVNVEITQISFGRLTAWVEARKIGDDVEWTGPQIKAVTYHGMQVDDRQGEWQARVIFDV